MAVAVVVAVCDGCGVVVEGRQPYPFPDLASSGRLEVQILTNPAMDEFQNILGSTEPNFVYFQGEQLDNEREIDSLVWRDVRLSSPEVVAELFGAKLPTIVYLEIPNGESVAEALYAKNNYVVDSQNATGKLGPHLLGEAPKISMVLPEKDMDEEEDDEGSPANLPAIKIYDDDMNMKFLVCGVPCTLDACLLGALEDGLNALLRIELLESHIKNELIEKSQLVHALPSCEENSQSLCEPRRSASIACGASIFEVCMKVPTWAAQVLRQLAPDMSYRSFSSLGIASIQGSSVASFEKEDAERLLFFCNRLSIGLPSRDENLYGSPSWLRPPLPSGKRSRLYAEATSTTWSSRTSENGFLKYNNDTVKESQLIRARRPLGPARKRGHARLIPQGGLAEFPDAILNAKRLDLYSLYREGVGNTLKRHYETYLLEYELAHDDVDGECCLLCHSSAAGDWVNCGVCGEWAHFGCDRRQGLGAFKDPNGRNTFRTA
ncbi:AT-rich interactive domain-containing protein 4 [Acorus calamus]|uniref:AT-rich interactive domain-containing protein 4 n=1 Tax=Acorus calamus TaxID=4465 RepID=A0AAV9EME4_ACOCL|nr:AT-rich interactive domain-containing protein 4 [Acorus calamus]